MADKPEKPRKDACKLKEEYTSHWDLDALPQDELEELMLKDRGGSEDGGQKTEDGGRKGEDDDGEVEENPMKIGGMLFGFAFAALLVGWLILRSG